MRRANEVVVPVEVACDEEQRDTERVVKQGGDGRPEGGVDDLDFRPKPSKKTSKGQCQLLAERERERRERRKVQKINPPEPMSVQARKTKTGPAAPVSQSAKLKGERGVRYVE